MLALLLLPVYLLILFFILHFVVACLLFNPFFILMLLLYFCIFVDHVNEAKDDGHCMNISRNHIKRLLFTMSAKSKEFSIQWYAVYNITLLSEQKVLNTFGRCKQFLALLIKFLLGIFVIKMLLQQQQ